jgi:heptosyltransferase-2
MSLKNAFIKVFLKIRNCFEKNDPYLQRFLIVSTTALGDTLWGTPAIRALRKMYPKAYIAVLTSPIGYEALQNNPHIDEVFVVKDPVIYSLFHLAKRMRQREFSKAFILHTSQRLILPFCSLIGISSIVGTEGMQKGLDSLLTDRRELKPLHEIERRMQLVNASDQSRMMEIFLSKEAIQSAAAALKHIPPHIPLIGIHPGAKEKFRQWPASHYIAVAKALKHHLGAHIVITGSIYEKELVDQIAGAIGGATAFAGQTSLHTLGAIIQRMSLMITNDTGPMHVACAVKTPIIGLFAPSEPEKYGPYQVPLSVAIKKPRTCMPCLKKKCQDPFCLRQISTDEVFEAALKLFYRR